ncbi:MAG: J domain-containing protein [Actinomycetota bacterium]
MTRAYEILGIDPAASDAEVRAAYRRLAQIYHPDRFSSVRPEIREEAERRMMELNAAFAEICNIRPVRSGRDEEELPTGWRAAWDKVWQLEERWQEELERRRNEERARRAVHRRWEQIERVTRRRAQAWANEQATTNGSTPTEGADTEEVIELPSASNGKARPNLPNDRIRQARAKQDAVEAHEAAERLRRTIDLGASTRKSRAEGRNSG